MFRVFFCCILIGFRVMLHLYFWCELPLQSAPFGRVESALTPQPPETKNPKNRQIKWRPTEVSHVMCRLFLLCWIYFASRPTHTRTPPIQIVHTRISNQMCSPERSERSLFRVDLYYVVLVCVCVRVCVVLTVPHMVFIYSLLINESMYCSYILYKFNMYCECALDEI